MLQTGLSKDYYLTRIQHIEQDIRDNEDGIVILYTKKADLIKEWAFCEENIGTPKPSICGKIVKRLVELDCVRGIGHVYHSLGAEYKNVEMSELGGLGGEHRWESLTKVSGNSGLYALPHEISSLKGAKADWLRENRQFITEAIAEWRRRQREYDAVMDERGIPAMSDGDREPESTLHPYDPKKGHLYYAADQCRLALTKYAETFRQIMENIEQFPPQSEVEDEQLAKALANWATVFEALNEYFRPFADEKFSQSYTRWWQTEIKNRFHGKHAAGVMSKAESYYGEMRELTREQVGDKQIDLYKRFIKFAAALECIQGIIVDFPERWHQKLMVPCIADRKIRVHSILSEGAFGSDRNK